MSEEVVLRVDELSVDLATSQGWTPVIEHISFEVRRNEFVGLVGESGSGKSVTGLAIMGLLPSKQSRISGGNVILDGETITSASQRRLRSLRGDRMAMVFQEPMTSLNPVLTVGDQIAEGFRTHRKVTRKQAMARAVEVLDLVGIPAAERRARAYPHEFSGGMRQRAMIAMAISCEPDLLICDEPTTALDVTVQAQVLELLARLQSELGMGILLITHDLGVVAETCDRVVTMYAGEVVERSDVGPLFIEPWHPYSSALLQSILDEPDDQGQLAFIPGRPPDLLARPAGCRFNPRCTLVHDRCMEEHPALTLIGDRASRCHLVDQGPEKMHSAWKR